MSVVTDLAALLGQGEAAAIAAALRQRRLPHLAAQRAFPEHRGQVKESLTELVDSMGDPDMVAAVLDGIAAVPRAAVPEPVWTAPGVPGLEGRTTLAVADLINHAAASVYAATYSASPGSAYVQALKNAADRGVAVTIIVDREMQDQNGGALPEVLAAARVWAYQAVANGGWIPLQHAKLVVVDESSAFVTSANFSNAAAKLNLECGLLCHDASVAGCLVSQIETLYEHGVLVDW